MSGLVLSLSPGERFVVNGATLENGDKPGKIRIMDAGARILRSRDALHPSDVTTPVKRLYFAIQLIVTADVSAIDIMPDIERDCEALDLAFEPVRANLQATLMPMLARGNYYSALCFLKHLIEVEAELFNRFAGRGEVRDPEMKVA